MFETLANNLKHAVIIFAGACLLLPLSASAEMPFPTVNEPEGEGVKCVQPEHEMVRNHMNYILHQRDETVHDGIRTETYSLAKCIDCHVQPDAEGKIARHSEKEHFCNGCHEYASVQIDCFECHADRPQKYIKRANKRAPANTDTQTLKEQLHKILIAHEKSANDKKAEVRN